jgi:uncharacterized protein YdeI (YjbR/CyaY-like superfamily)
MSPTLPAEIRYFRSAAEFRTWLGRNHDKVSELWIGFYKKGAPKSGITYAEALDEALCFGWIDGVRKTVDDISYTNRFSPRKAKSIWSRVNLNHVARLLSENRMAPPGLAAYEARHEARMDRYSYEQSGSDWDPALLKQLRANRKAWSFFQAQPPYYQRTVKWWVMSAKREETRQSRMDRLIRDSAAGNRVGALAVPAKRKR